MKHMKKLLALVIAAVMMTGMCLTTFADASNPGYTTTFEGTSAMAAMANNVFNGADMEYDSVSKTTTVTVYTKLYSRVYNNTTVYGWISSLSLSYSGTSITMTPGGYATIAATGDEYPTQFSGTYAGNLTTGDSASFSADVSVETTSDSFNHADQSGTLTLTKK